MRTIELSEATEPLSDYARQVSEETVLLTRKGRPVATLMKVSPHTDIENLTVTTDPRFMALIERQRQQSPPGTGLSSDEARKRLGMPPARRPRPRKG